MKRYRVILAVMVFMGFVFLPAVPGRAEEAGGVSLNMLVREAVRNNPRIQAARHQYLAAKKAVKQAVSLQDPHLSVGYFGQNVETRVGPQIAKYSISQKFPFWGKLTLKGRVALNTSAIAYQNYKAVEQEVIRDVKDTYYDLYWVRKSAGIVREVKGILGELEKSAQSKYATGIASQQDVMKAQVEISKLLARLYDLSQQEDTLREKLNTLLNRPVATPLGRQKDLKLTKFSYTAAQLQDLAGRHRQELKAAELDIKKNTDEVALKRKDYFPDFTVGVDYIDVGSGHTTAPNDGQDAWMGMVSVNVPLWRGRIKAEVDQAKDELAASRNMYQHVRDRVDFQIKDQLFQLKTAKELVNLYRNGLIPQAEESFKASQAGYETGKTDFLNLIDSERVLLNFKIAYYKSFTDYEKSVANLERTVGIRFSE